MGLTLTGIKNKHKTMSKTRIVGTEFSKAKALDMKIDSQIVIKHDKDNRFDKDALGVYFNNEHLGFIGKTDDIYDIDRVNFPIKGTVVDFYIKDGFDDKFKRHEIGNLVSATIEIEEKVELKVNDNVKSFNEESVIINFNEETHTYTNPITNNILTGSTTYIKKYIEPFSSYALTNCVKYWNLEKETIQGAWDLSGDVARGFGTAIHKALEYEDLYRFYKKPKDGTRCFQIKHPIIKQIVADFFTLNDSLGYVGKVIPEALITDVENNLCALADRVLVTSWENKTCRLQDYKLNHGFTKVGECKWNSLMPLDLPTTKLSKLALQLRFQAQMLEKSGWTIEGFDAFVLNDKWEHYEVTRLDTFNIITGKIK